MPTRNTNIPPQYVQIPVKHLPGCPHCGREHVMVAFLGGLPEYVMVVCPKCGCRSRKYELGVVSRDPDGSFYTSAKKATVSLAMRALRDWKGEA